MELSLSLLVALSVVCVASAQYYQQQQPESQYRPEQDQYYARSITPIPAIIMHKQAQNHNGEFKFAFAADNGLQQGESIAPDGTRTGGYSYVDPSGKKISLKYTAGKEGFRILEADHLPKAPQPIHPLPAPAPVAYSAPPPAPFSGYRAAPTREDDGQYRPAPYQAPPPPRYPAYAPSASSNSIQQKEIDYQDEPGKPHSFGSGYSFEFAG